MNSEVQPAGIVCGFMVACDGWQQVLGANPDDTIELDIDDWLFFFGRDTKGADND